MKNFLIVLAVAVVATASYWLLSPVFTDKKIDESLPVIEEQFVGEKPDDDISTEVTRTEQNEAGVADVQRDEPMPSPDPLDMPDMGPFAITGTPGHRATGEVRVLPGESTVVRYENYNGTNGPDLFVYLSNDLEATDYVSLGRARGNIGNINYQVPAEVDVTDYKYVLTWCQAFGVLFDYAEIN